MHIQVQVSLGHVHCLYCGARKECIVSSYCIVLSSYELFDGQQAHLGFVTVTDTQQVALQGVQRRNSLWMTWEVERRPLPSSSSSCSLDAAVLPGSAGAITASTISPSV